MKNISPYIAPGLDKKKQPKISKSFRLDSGLVKNLEGRARKENRTLNSLVETFLMIGEINAHAKDKVDGRDSWDYYERINEVLSSIADEERELNEKMRI